MTLQRGGWQNWIKSSLLSMALNRAVCALTVRLHPIGVPPPIESSSLAVAVVLTKLALSAPTEVKGRSDFKTVALSAPTEVKGRGDFFRGSRATGIPWTSEWRSSWRRGDSQDMHNQRD